MITRNNSDKDEKARDPVCDMWVDPGSHAVNYLGIRYVFCSRQCYERFLANPHVYVGLPGKPAPKQ